MEQKHWEEERVREGRQLVQREAPDEQVRQEALHG